MGTIKRLSEIFVPESRIKINILYPENLS
jgi:hypothetical protein